MMKNILFATVAAIGIAASVPAFAAVISNDRITTNTTALSQGITLADNAGGGENHNFSIADSSGGGESYVRSIADSSGGGESYSRSIADSSGGGESHASSIA